MQNKKKFTHEKPQIGKFELEQSTPEWNRWLLDGAVGAAVPTLKFFKKTNTPNVKQTANTVFLQKTKLRGLVLIYRLCVTYARAVVVWFNEKKSSSSLVNLQEI